MNNVVVEVSQNIVMRPYQASTTSILTHSIAQDTWLDGQQFVYVSIVWMESSLNENQFQYNYLKTCIVSSSTPTASCDSLLSGFH